MCQCCLFLLNFEPMFVSVSANGELNFQKVNAEFESFIPPDMELTVGSEKSIQMSNKIKEFYFKDEQPSWTTFDELILVCIANYCSIIVSSITE